MSNPLRWIDKFSNGSKATAHTSATTSVRVYTGEEMRAWFGPPAGRAHGADHGVNCCCAMARRHVRFAAGERSIAAGPAAVVQDWFEGSQ